MWILDIAWMRGETFFSDREFFFLRAMIITSLPKSDL